MVFSKVNRNITRHYRCWVSAGLGNCAPSVSHFVYGFAGIYDLKFLMFINKDCRKGCDGSFFKFCEMCFTSSSFGRIMKPPLSPSISPSASIHRFCSSLVCYRSNFFYYRNYKSETVDCSFHTIWYICSTTSSRRPLFKNFDLANCAFVEGRWEKKLCDIKLTFLNSLCFLRERKSSFCSFRSFLMKTKHWTIIEAVLCCNKRKISKNTEKKVDVDWREKKKI